MTPLTWDAHLNLSELRISLRTKFLHDPAGNIRLVNVAEIERLADAPNDTLVWRAAVTTPSGQPAQLVPSDLNRPTSYSHFLRFIADTLEQQANQAKEAQP